MRLRPRSLMPPAAQNASAIFRAAPDTQSRPAESIPPPARSAIAAGSPATDAAAFASSPASGKCMQRLRACRATQARSGCCVAGEIHTRREPVWMNTKRDRSTSPESVQAFFDGGKSHCQNVSPWVFRSSSQEPFPRCAPSLCPACTNRRRSSGPKVIRAESLLRKVWFSVFKN